MDLEKVAAALSGIERKALAALAGGKSFSAEELAKASGLNTDSARRAISWLAEKGLAAVSESTKDYVVLTTAGLDAFKRGLPEVRFIKALQKVGERAKLEVITEAAELSGDEQNAALGIARKNAWVSIHKDKNGEIEIELTGLEKEANKNMYGINVVLLLLGDWKVLSKQQLDKHFMGLAAAETLLKLDKSWIDAGIKKELPELERRGLAEETERVERSIAITDAGKEVLGMLPKIKGERAYNIQGAVPEIFIGKKQPYVRFLLQMRKKLLELGFQEMPARLVEMEFYNFDVLFQPQNHPARSWSDTYSLKNPKAGRITERDALKKVKAAHENGGSTGSKGWGYNWSEEVASRLMPCAHGTAASARQLVNGVEIPGKYFAIARCFRPDVPDATHLSEFNQMEGFIVDPSFNFTHLLGMLKQFAVEMAGAEKVKFYPDYYPFTEPSVQISALHPQLGWVEFGGAGIFRPEITEQLGIKGKCLAWGLGIDRLAMFRLGINDIRELFSQNLDWLRKEKLVW